MLKNVRFLVVLVLACVFTLSFCPAVVANSEPNAADLIREVRESENWLHRIDSLQLRIEGKWSHPPESIAARRAELKKQSPEQEPDPERDWTLKPSYPDIIEYAIDFKGKRLRQVEETPGREYFLKIWDGKQAMRYAKAGRDLQQYLLEPTTKMFETIFGSLSWPRAQPHSFWWDQQNIEEKIKFFGRAEDFKVIGHDEFRGVKCHVLECTFRRDPPSTHRWYIGIEDHLLYGRREWINPEFVFEYWTLDYKQVALGCLLPMTQGYSMPSYNPQTNQHYIGCIRDVKIVDARVNEELSDELFKMKFEEGLTVIDERSGQSVVYNYIATPPSLIGKALPDFENITIDFNPEQMKGRILLVCFFDINQRPSRHCISQLAQQAKTLEEKGGTIFGVQVSKIEDSTLTDWVKKNHIPFPVGQIQGDEDRIRLTWGIKSKPWLILTDREHIVFAEGFGLDELDNKIKFTRK